MAELKTKATKASVLAFLKSAKPDEKQADGLTLLKMFEKITRQKAVMWGTSIVGFGKYHYRSERSAQEGDWPLVGFSLRKHNLSLYIIMGNTDNPLLSKLGKHKASVGCLYINKLSQVNVKILESLIRTSYNHMKKMYL